MLLFIATLSLGKFWIPPSTIFNNTFSTVYTITMGVARPLSKSLWFGGMQISELLVGST